MLGYGTEQQTLFPTGMTGVKKHPESGVDTQEVVGLEVLTP